MKKCFSKPLALVHKLEHSLTATTFYKIKLIPVHSGVIPVHSGPFRCHSGSFRSIPVSFRSIPVHSGVIPVHSGPFRLIPVHSAPFRRLVTPRSWIWYGKLCRSRKLLSAKAEGWRRIIPSEIYISSLFVITAGWNVPWWPVVQVLTMTK